MNLGERSDGELLDDVARLVGSQRETTAKLVAYLGEIEERRLHLIAGFSSMFDFCQQKLGMSEGEAFRRILAARLGRRFPVVVSLLASGSLNLTTLELVREHLTDENHVELFEAVSGRTKRDVECELARRFPQADVPTRIRRESGVVPLSEARFRVEFTASAALREKLERCRDLMSHANPGRELGVVIERAVDLLLEDLERRRLARRKRSRHESEGGQNGRKAESGNRDEALEANGAENERGLDAPRERSSTRVTNAVRCRVFERDGQRCTYLADDGRRCESEAFLELDHVVPSALGGSSDAENLRVRCRAHNQLWAEQVFGRERIEKRRHFCQQKSTELAASAATLEKVHLALVGLGFRKDQAKRAIAEVARKRALTEAASMELVLRDALLVLAA